MANSCKTMQNTEDKSKFQSFGNRCDNVKTWRFQSNDGIEEDSFSKGDDTTCTENWRNLVQSNNACHKNVKINNINNENKNTQEYKKENFSSPLIGYISEGAPADWESIEITNIETLLASSIDLKFFRIIIDKDSMKESMQSNGSLHVPYDIYQVLKQCPSYYNMYLLLEVCSELHWRSKQLVGIAKICDLSFDKNKIRVNYLCLSKTEIDLHCCDENNLTALKPVFTSYISLLKAKSLQPLLPDIPPWSSVQNSTLLKNKASEQVAAASAQVSLHEINHSIANKWKITKDKDMLDRNRPTEHAYTEQEIQALTELYESNNHETTFEPGAIKITPKVKSFVGPLENHINSQGSHGRHINSVQAEVVDLTVDEDKDQCNGNTIPPLQGLFNNDKSLSTKLWQTIEYENLSQIIDFTGRRFFMCDMELTSIYNSFGNGGLLAIEQKLYDKIPDMQPNPTYLVLRKNSISKEFKPVIGLAKVVYKIKNDIQNEVQVTYLCISRAQYVLNPWGEDDVFSDGEEIVCLEDIKILLDEYKMSARHKKVNPLFDYVYPWSGTPPVMNPRQRSGKATVMNRSNSNMENKSHGDINENNENSRSKSENGNLYASIVNDDSANKQFIQSNANADKLAISYNEHSTVNQTSNTRNIMDRMVGNSLGILRTSNISTVNSNKNEGIEKKSNVNFSPVEQCIAIDNSNDNSHNELEWLESSDNEFRVEETDSVSTWDGNFEKASIENSFNSSTSHFKPTDSKPCIPQQNNISAARHGNSAHPPINTTLPRTTISSRNLAGSKISDKSKLPPLRGLFISGTKTVTNQSWEEIERNNLSYISQPGSINEFFLCNTDISSIRKSFRECNLEVSAKNMENIASLGRVRKLLILRAQISSPNKFVVIGIAMVNPSAGVAKDEKSEKYSAKVTYLCLSTFPGNIFAASQGDGVEVFAHVSSGFIQQYMLALRQRTVRPLFSNIYPWNSDPAPKHEPISTPSPPATNVKCDIDNHIESKIDRLQGSYEEDLFARYGTNLVEQTISFQQIDDELSQAGEKTIEYEPISVPLKGHVKKEIVESRMKQYSCELSRIISKSDLRSSYDSRKRVAQKKLFDIPDKSATGVKKGPGTKTSRGRGRGMVILRMANASSSEGIC